jgi:transcriptional regulator with XRE-family HTH domain
VEEGLVLKRIPTPEGAVLRFFRFSKGMSEQAFALMVGVDGSTVYRWENGALPLSRDRLVELLEEHLQVPPEAVDEALSAHRKGTQPPEEPEGPFAPSEPERRLIGRAAGTVGRAAAEAARRALARERLRQRAARHTAWAADEWARLKALPANLQEKAVRALQGGERSWALAVRLCEASTTAAAHSAAEALRLARLGVRLAHEVPGSARWRWRLLGHCEPFAANALRVGGNLTAAREAFARADELWTEGEGGDPAGVLDATRRLDLKASLLKHQGQSKEALLLLDQALQGARTDHARGRLLLKRAFTLEQAGAYATALETLKQAEPLIDTQREPRLEWVLLFNRGVNYCHLDLYQEAGSLLPRVEALAADLQTELDEIRTLWLRGKTRAGVGHREEGLAALAQVRQYFHTEQIAYDYALVSLELATLYLEQGRAGLVKEMAEEMRWIFEGQRVHQEALAALALFRHAAEMEEAQADWTRGLVKYLYRAQHNPTLRFEA